MKQRRGGTDPLDFARASVTPSAGVILAQRRQTAGWLLFQVAEAAGDLAATDVYRIEQGLDNSSQHLVSYARALDLLAADPPCGICHVAHSLCCPEDCAGHLLAMGRGGHR